MAIDPVLLRSKVIGADGLMTREWVRQQTQLQSAAGQVSTVTNNVTDVQVGSSFDDNCVRDFQPAIWDAYLLDQAPSTRDFAPLMRDVQLLLSGDTTRVYDDSELRALFASVDTPRVYDDSELRGTLASVETANHLGFQQQIDEVRALLAAGDPNLFCNLGSAAFQPVGAFDAAGAAAAAVAAAFPAFASFTPTLSGSGSMTVSGLSITSAEYCTSGNFCYFTVWLSFTLAGTAAATVSVSVPKTHTGALNNLSASATLAGASYWSAAFAYITGETSSVSVNPGSAANWPLGSTQLIISGSYRIN